MENLAGISEEQKAGGILEGKKVRGLEGKPINAAKQLGSEAVKESGKLKVESGKLNEYLDKYWKPYLKVIKVCDNYRECGYSKERSWINAIKTTESGNKVLTNNIILNDGILLVFKNNGQILVNLNSFSGPNRWGRDFFAFSLSKRGIQAAGISGNSINSYCNKTYQGSDNGEYCAAKIIQNGWKIKNDYPW